MKGWVLMQRNDYLQVCQKVSMLKSKSGIKQNVPDDLKVIHNEIVYYPVAYELSFNNGKTQHTAILHDLKANSITRADLEAVIKHES